MRRLLAASLSLVLVGLSAGLEPYVAWAQVRVSAVPTRAPVAGGAGMVGANALGGAPSPVLMSLPVPVSLPSVLPTLTAPGVVPHGAAVNAVVPGALPAPAAMTAVPQTAPALRSAPVREAAGMLQAPAAEAEPAGPTAHGTLRAAAADRALTRGSAASEALAAAGSITFDGGVLRQGQTAPVAGTETTGRARRPAFNPAAEEGTSRQEDGAAAPAPAPLLEGRLDLAAFTLPFDLRLRRLAVLGAHYGLLAAVPVLLTIGLGFVPVAVGLTAAVIRGVVAHHRPSVNAAAPLSEYELRHTREMLKRLRVGEQLSDDERTRLEESAVPFEQLLVWGESTIEYLTGRLGIDPARAPRLFLDEASFDLHWAASSGAKLDRTGTIFLGIGYILRPLERAVGVVAHEMGHLFFGDKGWLRERFRMKSGVGGGFLTGLTDAGTVALAALVAYVVPHAYLVIADPTLLMTLLSWGTVSAVGAMASAAVGLLAGLAATRHDELRADWFSAWLTDPAWLSAYLSEEASKGREPRGTFARWADELFSTHPAWETRVERLAGDVPRPAVVGAVVPVSDSLWGLSGSVDAVVRGAGESIGAALVERAAGAYDFRLYNGDAGRLVVRAHPTGAARLDAAPDAALAKLLADVLAEKHPGASVESVSASPHPIVETLGGSALGRELLAELAADPITVRWETGWEEGGPRAALLLSGPRPEIALNAAVYWKASPKAAAAALAHELFHYKVVRRLRAQGITWMDMGGLEFERLAQGVGFRVFAELGGEPADDLPLFDGTGHFSSGLKRWMNNTPSGETDSLVQHGYDSFIKLAELRGQDPAGLALELGDGHSAETVKAQLDAAWALHLAESRAETSWTLRHPLLALSARFLP
ncbi:MAG: M48 family metalloprotease [Elusimicrobia bacterium]|nr:M48 family metalloprotease [Elusimicrobiota bacterium]